MNLNELINVYSVAPRRIFELLNQYGCPNIEPKSFSARFVERLQNRLGREFEVNLETLNPENFSDRALSHGGVPSVPLRYTTDTFTRYFQKTHGTTVAYCP